MTAMSNRVDFVDVPAATQKKGAARKKPGARRPQPWRSRCEPAPPKRPGTNHARPDRQSGAPQLGITWKTLGYLTVGSPTVTNVLALPWYGLSLFVHWQAFQSPGRPSQRHSTALGLKSAEAVSGREPEVCAPMTAMSRHRPRLRPSWSRQPARWSPDNIETCEQAVMQAH